MKKLLLLFVSLSVLVSCVGKKQIEKQLNSGNYDLVITNALKKLERNKHKKRKQAYVSMLEEAYYSVVEDDLNTIARFKATNNPEFYQRIFDLYLKLEARQNAIAPVLPLKLGNRTLDLNFNNYDISIAEYRVKVSEFYYNKSISLLDSNDKIKAREAYKTLKYINRINPDFKDVNALLSEAKLKGTEYVLVSVENETNQIIPRQLENDLLDFDTYGLNKFWASYHANLDESIDYDYAMQLQLKRIRISPEHVFKKQILRQKELVDGWEYLLDENGNVAKDSLGNDIKVDKIITARARFFEHNQSKSTQLIAEVVFTDLKANEFLESFPIDSEFVFENQFGTVRGDRRALTKSDRQLLKHRFIRFPSNEQMVFDTGEDLKQQLKRILKSYDLPG